jgi:hypothetical protein
MKTMKGGVAMERKQMQAPPARRVSQQNQKGGEAMRKWKFVWSTVDARGRLVPYVVLEVSKGIAKKIKDLSGERAWMFIAEKLHEKYPKKFPSWFDEYGRTRVFWYNHVLEDYERAYDRVMGEVMEELRDYYDDEEALLEVAKDMAKEDLDNLPVVKL